MEKPRKKEYREGEKPYPLSDFCINKGFNQAIDAYETFLPSEGELHDIVLCILGRLDSKTVKLVKYLAKRIGK